MNNILGSENRLKEISNVNIDKYDIDKLGKLFKEDKKSILDRINQKNDQCISSLDIIKLLAGGAFIGLTLFFPTLPMIMAPFVIDGNKFKKYRLNQTINRLKKRKLVEIEEINGNTIVKITEQGKVKALQYKINDIQVKRQNKWDNKWRIIIFDIPEDNRKVRDEFRKRLKSMGFIPLQESVWVHAFRCFDQIEYLRQLYGAAVCIKYIIADEIEDQDELIEYFQLK